MASTAVGVLPAVISAGESLSALHTSLQAVSSSPGATQLRPLLSLTMATKPRAVPLLPSEGARRRRRRTVNSQEPSCQTREVVCASAEEPIPWSVGSSSQPGTRGLE